jgi:5'-3' exoribonuclease 1
MTYRFLKYIKQRVIYNLMGIPSYFSHIIKNYPYILKKFKQNLKIDNLFLDSNSIIYDCLRTVEYTGNDDYELVLINVVCKQIENYIQQLSPNNLVYIAFDGVAPVAKLTQQKTRRYKSWFISDYDSTQNKWDSTAITPGTEFMNKLNLQIRYYFRHVRKYNVNNIIVSGSDSPGEGEHKIFEYIRENSSIKNQKTVIYGLDADLIMLTINHLSYCNDMSLFRETPEFIKSIDQSLDPNYLYIIDTPKLKEQLVYYLNNDKIPETPAEKNRVHDYIFMCFMLGNDFLPHSPSLNIRTNGLDILMETYRNTLGKNQKNIINNGKIIWKNFKILVKELANNEEQYIQQEYVIRNKQENRISKNNNKKEEEKLSKYEKELLNVPCKEREIEKYINPNDKYWESRYYDMLFDIDKHDLAIKQICINYLEGLEWTWKYYYSGCIDWRWKYNYHYPPLLQDLLKYIPYFEEDLLVEKEKNPVKVEVQLSYVLPKNSLHLLPHRIKNHLLSNYTDYYRLDYEFTWAFCKYFWECHVNFPIIGINSLEEIVT